MKLLLITLGIALRSLALEIEQLGRPAIEPIDIDERPIDLIPPIPFPPNGCPRG